MIDIAYKLPYSSIIHMPAPNSPTVLVVTDVYDQTQELAFLRPVKYSHAAYGCGIIFISEKDIDHLFEGISYFGRLKLLENIFGSVAISSIIFSRYTGKHYQHFLRYCDLHSIPSYIFLDDNLLEVPEIIGKTASNVYNNTARRSSMLTQFEQATSVVASTKGLEVQLEKYPHKALTHTPIYCSYLDSEVFNPPDNPDDTFVFGYMASRWHHHDLDNIAEEVGYILEEFPNTSFEVFGFDWQNPIRNVFHERIKCHPPSTGGYSKFRGKLSEVKWDLGIAPLRYHEYNKCKANTKWIEYTCAGFPTIVSNLEPYRNVKEGCTIHSGNGSFFSNIIKMMQSKDLRQSVYSEGREFMIENFSIERHAGQVVSMFYKL